MATNAPNKTMNHQQEMRSHSRPSADAMQQPLMDLVEYARDYVRKEPEVAALWCLGIGFVLGWKLKPW